MLDLTGLSALVTGGSRGIGLACVQALHDAGARVAFTCRRAPSPARLAELFPVGDVPACIALDLDDPATMDGALDAVRDACGDPAILVNNAGIWNAGSMPVEKLPAEEVSRMMRVNFESAVQLTGRLVPAMRKAGFGRIVNVASTAAIRGEAGHGHYAASKGALVAWTRSLVGEVSPSGITANTVSPGWVLTDMTRDVLTAQRRSEIEGRIPTRRIATPEDVAAAVLFLASREAGQITGANLDVNGGVFCDAE